MSAGREFIARLIDGQRGARGKTEFVSVPRTRKAARRMQLAAIWVTETAAAAWRRFKDPHLLPGRWGTRLLLLRPGELSSFWLLFWLAVGIGCGYVAFYVDTGDAVDWAMKWGLGGAAAAFVAVIWQDGIKSPHAVRRIRRRIIADPEALLRTTLAEKKTKIIELDPPLNTIPREDLYEELLPGILARKKKDVQIIVGSPGAGKTTALIEMATVLAKIGFIPVFLDMRGERSDKDLFELAKERFEKQVRPLVRTGAETEIVWRWLCRRQRVVFAVDDFDQIRFDGESGFVMRQLLEEVAAEGQTVLVTARPAGVPMGIAASAVTMEPLEFETAVKLVARPALQDPGAVTSGRAPRARIERWIKAGELTETPLYLEALAELTAAGACPDLPDDPERWAEKSRPGRWRQPSAKKREWNPVWVRYLLLSRFYARIVDGRIRRGLGIDSSDRRRTMKALSRAALGTLAAVGEEATAKMNASTPEQLESATPRRTSLVDFISSDDRQSFTANAVNAKVVKRRTEVSQHEAIDTGIRLRIVEERRGEPQFRHRIMQAFLAGRCLAELARERGGDENGGWGFERCVTALMNSHHPEKLTAHMALVFAAIHSDQHSLEQPLRESPAWTIANLLYGSATAAVADSSKETLAEQLDPWRTAEEQDADRRDPDDELIKLTTAATILGLVRRSKDPETNDGLVATLTTRVRPSDVEPEEVVVDCPQEEEEEAISPSEGAMRWTKLRALAPIAEFDTQLSWEVIWEFTRDPDYDVRHAASQVLERNACRAYPKLEGKIEAQILKAGGRAAAGLPLQSADSKGPNGWDENSMRTFVALGWVLPAIVSGLGEELRTEQGHGVEPEAGEADRADGADGHSFAEAAFHHARLRLEEFCALAYAGGRHELEESLAQGFKADAMRHASEPDRGFTGPGWVAHNRRLVADIAIPHAESWYARMLLYQALALYAIAGTNKDDTFDLVSHRLHLTRERHPLARQAAKLGRSALKRARLKRECWPRFIWSDEVEDAGHLPTFLGRKAAQLVGDVAMLVDLKDGSPPDRHANFGHMEELPYCLSASPNRHEILGSGCPEQCGWGFCPYRAASPDEPNEHRGISRGFCRSERRKVTRRSPPWQSRITKRRLSEYWEQMEFKARR